LNHNARLELIIIIKSEDRLSYLDRQNLGQQNLGNTQLIVNNAVTFLLHARL